MKAFVSSCVGSVLLLVTAATLGLAVRGVDFATLVRDMGRANLPLLIGLSVPSRSVGRARRTCKPLPPSCGR